MSEKGLILLSASPITGAGTAEGSGVESEARRIGDQMHGRTLQKKMERLPSEADMRRNVFIGNN
jgi:hypothetical protein